MEKQYQSGMQGNALLNYMISDSMREKAVDKEIGMIRGNNRAALLLILLFCGIFAVLLSILFQDALFFLICAGLAAFMTISFFIITAYRVRKAVKSGNQILVTEKGAFAFGQFHSWSIAGSWLDTARYDEPAKTLWICYSAVSRTGPVSCTVRIPVPEEQEEPARRTVSILTSIAAHK
jgi:hypothetical protein